MIPGRFLCNFGYHFVFFFFFLTVYMHVWDAAASEPM